MNNRRIQEYSSLDSRELDNQIAQQCAPLLTGVKISNILKTHRRNMERVYTIFSHTTVKAKCIYSNSEEIMMFLYKPEELEQVLKDLANAEIMVSLGYKYMDLEEVLESFTNRFHIYMEDRKTFPHEMGLLLGYPAADVMGFIENKGKDYLYSGYWKVYSNLEEALNTFHQYQQAKEVITGLIACGMSIQGVLQACQLYQRKSSVV